MARERRTPVFLHLRTVRYLGHAGSDVEISYRTPSAVEAELAADPILGTARALRQRGATRDRPARPGATPSGTRSRPRSPSWPAPSCCGPAPR